MSNMLESTKDELLFDSIVRTVPCAMLRVLPLCKVIMEAVVS